MSLLPTLVALLAASTSVAAAASLPNPLFAAYWGQSNEQSLISYCQMGYFNVISIGFVSSFGERAFSLNTDGCTATATSGSCNDLGGQIKACQAAGVKILMSYGGATKYDCGSSGCTGDYFFTSATQAEATATQAWQMFFNGGQVTSGVARPFGSGVTLDGIDLDIEMTAQGDGQNYQLYYDSFAKKLKSLDSNIIVSAAPECQSPAMGGARPNPAGDLVVTAPIDFFFVQFFNNPLCNVASSGFAASFQYWTQAAAANPNGGTKLLIGVPGNNGGSASLSAAYYVTPANVLSNVNALKAQYPNSQIGVGVYDAAASVGSQESGSDPNFAQKISSGLRNLGSVPAAAAAAPSTPAAAAASPAAATTPAAAAPIAATAAVVASSSIVPIVANTSSAISTSRASSNSLSASTFLGLASGMASTTASRASAASSAPSTTPTSPASSLHFTLTASLLMVLSAVVWVL